MGLPWWLRWLTDWRLAFDLWVGKIPWRRAWLPTSVFLPGEFHGQRSLAGSWCCKELNTIEQLILDFEVLKQGRSFELRLQ